MDETFHGWTVASDEDANSVTLTKPHESAPDGVLRVRVRGGADTPHHIVRAIGARNALAEDARLAPEDDRDLWQARHQAAAAHVKRLHADERRKHEPETETPEGGQDAIIDAGTLTARAKGAK